MSFEKTKIRLGETENASNMEAWKTPICCCKWMLKVLPRDFSSLDSIFCCKAVPVVGGTDFAGVLTDND